MDPDSHHRVGRFDGDEADDYRAGFVAGYTEAYNDERRIPEEIILGAELDDIGGVPARAVLAAFRRDYRFR